MEEYLPIQVETLPNGLTLVFCDMPWAQSIAAELRVRAGSRYETPETWGMAHFLEHLLFEGTEHHPNHKALSEALNTMGGELDAYTTREATVFTAVFPKEHQHAPSDFLRELIGSALFREDDVAKEKEIISQEIAQRKNDPSQYSWDFAMRSLWPAGHPLGRDTGGSPDSIQQFSAQALRSYRDQMYVPMNMTIMVTGALTPETKEYFRNVWGTIPSIGQKSIPHFDPGQALVGSEVKIQERLNLDQVYHAMAIPIPFLNEKTYWMGSIISEVLRQRIFNALVYEKGLAYQATTYVWRFIDHGVLMVRFVVAPKSLSQAQDIVRDLVIRPISDEEIKQAKAALKKYLFLHLADTNAVAEFLADQAFFFGAVVGPDKLKQQIDDVAPTEVRAFHERTIAPAKWSVSEVRPSKTDEKI